MLKSVPSEDQSMFDSSDSQVVSPTETTDPEISPSKANVKFDPDTESRSDSRNGAKLRAKKKGSILKKPIMTSDLSLSSMKTDSCEVKKLLTRQETVTRKEDNVEVWPASAAWFMGPKAENVDFFKELVENAINQHVDFRKFKYFPMDPPYVTTSLKESPSYKQAQKKIKSELHDLTQRLKNSVPFFNFRSQGHMLWDITIPSGVGYLAAMLYNQNNVASMASGVTLQLEREVGADLCRMVGYNVDSMEDETNISSDSPTAWGHLPNGGTVANLEAMWAARCLKFNGLTIQKMMKERFECEGLAHVRDTFMYKDSNDKMVLLRDADAWQLLNIPVDDAINLFDSLLLAIKKSGHSNRLQFEDLFSWVQKYTLEELGGAQFYDLFKEELDNSRVKKFARWFVPGSRHYSWDKGANILGLGRQNLVKIGVDKYCRMDIEELRSELTKCLEERIPVIGVTAVFGTTQEGAVDSLDEIVELRNYFSERGLTFYIHVDGAWGGYFASVMWDKHNEFTQSFTSALDKNARRHSRVDLTDSRLFRRQNTIFLQSKVSKHFARQLYHLEHANSVTLDPHKSGFCPYPAGGLLYRNGNIRKFLAQKAGYVSHGTGRNEEINLFGIDGSKPGAASAGVWLSHKVIGLHEEGYGLLLEQCSFSAGNMYALWVSLERKEDPFTVVPAIPVKECFRSSWTSKRIRKEILEADNWRLKENTEAITFMKENGPDTLINCVSINLRKWNEEKGGWEKNTDLLKQKEFVDKFYKRCSHSFERPAMVDRGIQIILNSTHWTKESHSRAYSEMKESLGLDMNDEADISLIINTCMSPWLTSQKTFKRIGTILRNELYNAHGAIMDNPEQLFLVSPNIISNGWNGTIFAELEASFSNPSLQYHAIGRFFFNPDDVQAIKDLAAEVAFDWMGPLKIVTRRKMRVFDLMTGGDGLEVNKPSSVDRKDNSFGSRGNEMKYLDAEKRQTLTEKLEDYTDENIEYQDIAMPEIEVIVYYGKYNSKYVESRPARMKIKRILRYHHLMRDQVDEKDYPPSQEYFLYSDRENAYLSHCPNRFPDFQQQIQLHTIPTLTKDTDSSNERDDLYREALMRGVVIYLPQIETGGRPLIKKGQPIVCKDPIKSSVYNAVSWSDQGAFTGEMYSITIEMHDKCAKRWFEGKKINKKYNRSNFPWLHESYSESFSSSSSSSSASSSPSSSDNEMEPTYKSSGINHHMFLGADNGENFEGSQEDRSELLKSTPRPLKHLFGADKRANTMSGPSNPERLTARRQEEGVDRPNSLAVIDGHRSGTMPRLVGSGIERKQERIKSKQRNSCNQS